MLPVCQGLLGMNGQPDKDFLDPKKHSIDELWEFFEQVELEGGILGLDVYADQSWHTVILATIKTTLRYGEDVNNQTFLNLVEDFVEHVRGLPLADLSKREGALWTDADIERGYSEEANRRHAEAHRQLDEAYLQALQKIGKQKPEEPVTDDEIIF
ncbi:hypothetical protein A2671_00125 [Candidatus Kaiserbacteria bacterium RIFCSPHIGHO2_01_FULL_49_13]|uniref:Uncharacterized protein n=1 Tax=Candidatus Kaiserbacteria bacterium RIFCSPHIGHO2_01_FULL_49_13 TaxID=1798477 RepID=A0A1F6CEA0_9BACT|nr:MAG: hypothetical protein A2671_00125 [Candidatus Kaiserbacteria bacterium RIFCSPHIGHO2_01_FULL_49_13]